MSAREPREAVLFPRRTAMDEKKTEGRNGFSRRGMLGSTAAGLAGLAAGATSTGLFPEARAQQRRQQGLSAEVKPGDLDEYYGFSSGGQSGEIRIIGLPSGRELGRIPIFNRCSATGWGQTNESLKTEGQLP